MAFNNFRVNFEFQGKLEVLEAKEVNGREQKGSVRDNGKGFTKVVLLGKAENQGDFYLEISMFSNPVTFTLNEVDSNGVNKKYDFNGGKLKYDPSEIKDTWKSNYKIKQGDKEQMFYHSKDFGNQVIKMLPNIKKNKDFIYKIKGTVSKGMYDGRVIENFNITQIDILGKVNEESYLKIHEMFAYKREDLKGISIPVYETMNIKTKDKGNKELFFKGNKTLKFHKDYIMNGTMSLVELKDNPIIKPYIEDLMLNELGKIKVYYKPVINKTKQEEEKIDTENLPPQFKISYDMLMNMGKEEEAKKLIQSVTNAIRISEGGGFREYYITEFEYSTDFALKVSETLTVGEFLETNLSNLAKATKNENKGKMLLNSLLINKSNETVIETNNIFDNSDKSFEDNLKDNDIIGTTEETVEEEDFFDKEEKIKEEQKETQEKEQENNTDEEFDEIFDVQPKKKKEEPKVEEKTEKVVEETKEEQEEDLFDSFFS